MTRHVRACGPGKAALALFAMSLLMVMGCATALAHPGLGRSQHRSPHHSPPRNHHSPPRHHPEPPWHHPSPPKPPKPPYDVTSRLEAARVDRVPAPEPDWEPCYEVAECASFQVPLDYDEPNGQQVELALLKVPARDPEEKVGSLFVNPGGPGGSSRSFALEVPGFMGPEVLDHFDIIGMDPRGVGGSTPIRCFDSFEERFAAWLPHLSVSGPPATPAQEEAELQSGRAVGQGCSTTGQPIASAMSTAEVARDMDVVRRAVGDQKLTYYGASYGSYLGEVYANLFPDRVRAITIDGVVDPQVFVGNPLSKYDPVFDRLRSADGGYKALTEILRRCAAVGQPTCKFGGGDPLAKFRILTERLRTETVPVEVGGYGEVPAFGTVALDYGKLIQLTNYMLEFPTGWESLDAMLSSLWAQTGEGGASPPPAATGSALSPEEEALEAAMSFEESLRGVVCSEGMHGPDASLWRLTGALADRRAPYFGRYWNFLDVACATSTWTARDEDAYPGPFNRRTDNPVLIVGGLWDPATNYDNAVSTWHLMPGSRLISSDSWGHASYWTSDCVGRTVDRYLVTAVAPPPLTQCKGVAQPFEASASISRRARTRVRPNLPEFGAPPLPLSRHRR